MEQNLLKEALQIDYRLRSTFFYRKLYDLGFSKLMNEIDNLINIADNFNWDNKEIWGISQKAWEILDNRKICPIAVFSHPRILQEQPQLSAYYRNVAVLPQKAVKKLVFSTIDSFENGSAKLKFSYDKVLLLCQLYNSHSSLIIESADEYFSEDIRALMYASAGASINGSWLNKIGEEAELLIRKLLIRTLLEQNYITSIIFKDGTSDEQLNNLIDKVELISGIRLKNQTSLLFSSEPDVSFLNTEGKLIAVIEIKGGKDTAGALERYGAAIKSFEQAKRENAEVITIFIASCLTNEVKNRLSQDNLINHAYNLTNIVADDNDRASFTVEIFRLIGIEFEENAP